MAAPAPLNEHRTRQSFVSSNVKENEVSTRIINAIFPYYPRQVTVIGAFLNQDDAVWKVNWHWESLIHVIDRAVAQMTLSEKHQNAFKAIRAVLMSNPPKPVSGYRAKNKLGDPKDESSMETILARWRILKQSKIDVRSVIAKAGIEESLSKATGSLSVLVVQPVLPPKETHHRFGWALDIKGRGGKIDNPQIISISKGLGATLTFDEQFHVHVEFKNGAKPSSHASTSAVPDAPSPTEASMAGESVAAVRDASGWDSLELLKATGRGWNRMLAELL